MNRAPAYILITLFNLIIGAKIGHCQNASKIEISDLMITKVGKQAYVSLGLSKAKVIEAFGRPITTKKSYFTKFDFKGEMIDYKGAQFYFVDNHLWAFELKSTQFSIKTKGKSNYATVGDALSGFNKKTSEGQFTNIVLQNKGVDYDEVLGFTFDAKHKISNITCGPD
jgi:hypothetical protein